MQRGDVFLDIEMDHHGGVLAVGPASGLNIPSRLDQPQEGIHGAGQQRPLMGPALAIAVIALPLREQRIQMRLQGGVELGRLDMGKFDPPAGELLIAALGDRGLRRGRGSRVGSWLQADRGAQLADRGTARQLRVMLIRPRASARRNDPT